MAKKVTKSVIESEVKKVTGTDPGSTEFDLGCVMLTASIVGINVQKIATFLQRPKSEIQALVDMCRSTGIFKGRTIYAEDWFGENGGIGFNLDIAVAMGWVERA